MFGDSSQTPGKKRTVLRAGREDGSGALGGGLVRGGNRKM
jgi:hypothetical protein